MYMYMYVLNTASPLPSSLLVHGCVYFVLPLYNYLIHFLSHCPTIHMYVCTCSNQIASIVDEDLKLKDLEELYLSKNAIQQVPDRFMASMLALRILDVSHNKLGKM